MRRRGRKLGVLALAGKGQDAGGDVSARVFFEALGIREDPATGSAAACLAAYLSSERWFGSQRIRVREQQGYEMGRPSCLYLGAEPIGDGFAVSVAGKVLLVARGEVE